jgi:opacity protein-like surface antigen
MSQGDNMARKTFCWALAALVSVACAPLLAQQPYYPPPPGYQAPPPSYQQAPPPNYQQAPPPNYQQQPPPNYQQEPPPNYQQEPPQNYQQQPPPNYQQAPPNYQQPPPAYPPPPAYQQAPQQPQPNTQAAAPPPAAHSYYTSKPQGFQYHPWRVQIEGGYTITSGDTKQSWQNGGNVGVGLTWFPIKELPFGFRVDGSYSVFDATPANLAAAGKNIGYGKMDMYGGDANAELDLQMGPKVREYLFGGFGWYRQRTTYDTVQYQYGLICDPFYGCLPGYFPVTTNTTRKTSDWISSWNAGVGFEFALQDPLSFFVEARYQRLQPQSSNNVFIPIRVGLRF